MKKIYKAFLYSSFALAILACEKEISPVEEPENTVPEGYTELVLTAVSEQTKTAMNGSGETVWSDGDAIKVICSDGTASNFTLVSGAGNTTGDFQGFVPNGKTALYAVYPADRYSSSSGSTVKVSIPASRAGDFGSGNIAVAKVAADHSMAFKNVNSFISFALPSGTEVTSVVVESVSGGNLGGTLSVDCSGDPTPGSIESGVSSITTTTTDGAGTYYIAIAPGVAHAKGFKLSYKKGDDVTGVYYLNRNITTAVNTNYTMGEVSTNGDYYVTVAGSGDNSGMNWANAMSGAQMWKKVTLTSAQSADAATKAAKIAAIDGATFHLGAGSYNFGSDPTISFSESSPVTLTFKGGYPAAGGSQNLASYRADFTGNDEHAVLNLRGKLNVSFERIGFVHGAVTGDNVGSLDINGTVAGSDLTVSMSNCLVDNNVNASYSSHDDEWAAGLVLDGVTSFTAENVTFSNNKSHSASAAFVRNSESVFTNCSFQNNSAWYRAGAVYVTANNNEGPAVTFDSCVFEYNEAETEDGGAIYAKGGEMIVNGGTIAHNTAVNGGAMVIGWGDVKIKGGAVISQNEAYLGGAIYNTGNDKPTLRISEDCEFNGNHATGWAGAIHFKSKGILRITDCTFSGNYSDGDSGALNIDNASADCKFTRVTFSGNHADSDAGGVMWIADGSYLFEGCTFTGNYSGNGNKGGGAIFAEKAGNIKIRSCGFSGNYAKRGGAISARNLKTGSLFIDACWFDGNYTKSSNSANKGTTITSVGAKALCINNCSFNDNTYNTSGGSMDQGCDWIYINGTTDESSSSTVMTDLVISNCTLIGACRTSASTLSSSGMELLYVTGLASGSEFYCINNCIISTGKSSDDGMWVKDITVNEFNNIYSSRGGSGSYTYNNTGSTINNSTATSTLSGLTWDPDDHVYPWDGTGFSYTAINAADFATQLNNGSSSFKSWLEDEGILNKDQLGTNRGNSSWVPGAYQPDI